MSAATLVITYLSAFYSGDFEKAGKVMSDDFHFKGPFVETASKEAFFASAARLAPITKDYRLLRQWMDGEEICSIYEVQLETPVGKGWVVMAEWHTIRHGKLASARLMLDTDAFRKLVPSK